MAIYPKATLKLIPPGPNDPKIKPDTMVLHVDGGNSPSLYNYFNGPSGGVESHFHIKRTGEVEQYRDTAYQADAQMGSGFNAISVETQGLASGEWTPQQVAALKDLMLWGNHFHDIPLHVVPGPAGPGIGYHRMFNEWTGGPRACPGDDRVRQFETVLVPWMRNPSPEEDDMYSDADRKRDERTAQFVRDTLNHVRYRTDDQVRAALTEMDLRGIAEAIAAVVSKEVTVSDETAARLKVAVTEAAQTGVREAFAKAAS